jgi:hypothetical protein
MRVSGNRLRAAPLEHRCRRRLACGRRSEAGRTEPVRGLGDSDHERTTAMRLFTGFERSFCDLVWVYSDLVRHRVPDMRCPPEWTHDKAD